MTVYDEFITAYYGVKPLKNVTVLSKHVEVLRAFAKVLKEETNGYFEWLAVPGFGFDLRVSPSMINHIPRSLLAVKVFELTPTESGGSILVNLAGLWDDSGLVFKPQRFIDTDSLQKRLAEVLRNEAFRRNLDVLVEMSLVNR